MRTAIAIHAHPDDESSKGAATIARLADRGTRCVLVCATGGEAGDILNPAMDRPGVHERLAELRREELDRAAAILGYEEVVHLGYRDSGMPGAPDNEDPAAFTNQPFADVLARIVAIVRREQPEVVFGYDDHERYPHPDHLKVHALSTALAGAAADEGRFPGLGDPWEIPLVLAPSFTARRALALHRAMDRLPAGSPLAARVAGLRREDDPAAGLVRVNVAGYVERARRALAAHATQVDPSGHWFAVPLDVVETVYPYEDFEVISARDGALGDFELFEPWDGGGSAASS